MRVSLLKKLRNQQLQKKKKKHKKDVVKILMFQYLNDMKLIPLVHSLTLIGLVRA